MAASDTDRIVKHIDLNVPLARVWAALTDYEQFNQWFNVNLGSPFVPGQVTRGNITHPGYEYLIMEVVVQQLLPMRLFSFTWHPYAIDPKVDYSAEPPTLVEFVLTETAVGTSLTVTESGFDKLPAHRRDEAFRMNSNGWQIHLTNIEAHVANP